MKKSRWRSGATSSLPPKEVLENETQKEISAPLAPNAGEGLGVRGIAALLPDACVFPMQQAPSPLMPE